MPQVIRDVENGAIEDEEARLEAHREHQARLAEIERQEADERRQWKAVLNEARPKAVEELRAKAFRQAYDDWIAATEIRRFCDALEDQADEVGAYARRWIAWVRTKADQLDPTRGEDGLAGIDIDIEPMPDDLRPFMGTWRPVEPRTEYRTAQKNQELADDRRLAKAWHPGLVGRPSWWRHER